VQVGQLYAQAAQALQLQPNSFKLVLKGSTITNSSTAAQAREAAGSISSSSTAVPSNGSNEGLTGLLRKRQGLEPVVPLSAGGEHLCVHQSCIIGRAGQEQGSTEACSIPLSRQPNRVFFTHTGNAWAATVMQQD
jgi:hypothetical protein